MEFDAYIFDLDGTLLDTLPDLVRLTNMVLGEFGWPLRTSEQILSYVGNGGRNLLTRAAPDDADEAGIDEAFRRWRELYPEHGHAFTKPYDGITETLELLKADGAKLGVLSNKFDGAVKQVIEEQFPGLFDLARGECDEIPRKPDPRGLLRMIEQLGVSADRVAYVGDSPSDIVVAKRAGVFSVGVSWGYRTEEAIREERPSAFVYEPAQLRKCKTESC